MSDDGDDLLRRQKEIFDAFFTKGTELAEELQRLNSKFAEMERENHDLATLYVAAHGLHAASAPRHMVQNIVEILLNFVGAKTFAIYALQDGRLAQVAAEGRPQDEPSLPERPLFPPDNEPPSPAAPVVVPMHDEGRVVGLIAVWELVPHKKALEKVDRELFNLLAARGMGLGALVS